ncbi:hypothetical protein L6452_14912 [Arctium lappa]|uniref:Uncharacterized protein n=1 Tax=Arctium lappa TaxID=4217 RepID=A0ACB9CMF6_ARCLA|nr:hypothetical protein L6452_14912 [Arctium lappa]
MEARGKAPLTKTLVAKYKSTQKDTSSSERETEMNIKVRLRDDENISLMPSIQPIASKRNLRPRVLKATHVEEAESLEEDEEDEDKDEDEDEEEEEEKEEKVEEEVEEDEDEEEEEEDDIRKETPTMEDTTISSGERQIEFDSKILVACRENATLASIKVDLTHPLKGTSRRLCTSAFHMAVTSAKPEPDMVVSKDGSGRFMTIGEAVATYQMPLPCGKQRYIIYVKSLFNGWV